MVCHCLAFLFLLSSSFALLQEDLSEEDLENKNSVSKWWKSKTVDNLKSKTTIKLSTERLQQQVKEKQRSSLFSKLHNNDKTNDPDIIDNVLPSLRDVSDLFDDFYDLAKYYQLGKDKSLLQKSFMNILQTYIKNQIYLSNRKQVRNFLQLSIYKYSELKEKFEDINEKNMNKFKVIVSDLIENKINRNEVNDPQNITEYQEIMGKYLDEKSISNSVTLYITPLPKNVGNEQDVKKENVPNISILLSQLNPSEKIPVIQAENTGGQIMQVNDGKFD